MLPVRRQIKDCFHILLGDQKKSHGHASKFLAGKPLAMPLAMKAPGWNYEGGAAGASDLQGKSHCNNWDFGENHGGNYDSA